MNITYKFIIFLLLMFNGYIYSLAQSDDIESLKGFKKLNVLIEIPSELENNGVHSNELQTDIELKLKLAGIKVISDEQQDIIPYNPTLYLFIKMTETNIKDLYAISLDLSFNQDVVIKSNSKVVIGRNLGFIYCRFNWNAKFKRHYSQFERYDRSFFK